MARQLDTGDPFPEYVANTVDGRTLKVPQAFSGEDAVLLYYRGHWWPYCLRQLADYQAHLKDFQEENIGLLALSVDPLDKAKETVKELSLDFPVAYGLEVPKDADRIGALWGERQGSNIFHATGFVLDPEGRVGDACYSNGPIGRIAAEDALSHVRFFKRRRQQG